jgi:hypothetical protein
MKVILYINNNFLPIPAFKSNQSRIHAYLLIDTKQTIVDSFVIYIVYASKIRSFFKDEKELNEKEKFLIKDNYLGKLVNEKGEKERLMTLIGFNPDAYEIREVIFKINNCSSNLQYCFSIIDGTIISYEFIHLPIEQGDTIPSHKFQYDDKISICETVGKNKDMKIFLADLKTKINQNYLAIIHSLQAYQLQPEGIDAVQNADFFKAFNNLSIPLLILGRLSQENIIKGWQFSMVKWIHLINNYIIKNDFVDQVMNHIKGNDPDALKTIKENFMNDHFYKQQIALFSTLKQIHHIFGQSFNVKGKGEKKFDTKKLETFKLNGQFQHLNDLILRIIQQATNVVEVFRMPGLYRTLYYSHIRPYITYLSAINNNRIINYLNDSDKINRDILSKLAGLVKDNLLKRVKTVESIILGMRTIEMIECLECDKELLNEINDMYQKMIKQHKNKSKKKFEKLFPEDDQIDDLDEILEQKGFNDVDIDFISMLSHPEFKGYLQQKILADVLPFEEGFKVMENFYCPV